MLEGEGGSSWSSQLASPSVGPLPMRKLRQTEDLSWIRIQILLVAILRVGFLPYELGLGRGIGPQPFWSGVPIIVFL